MKKLLIIVLLTFTGNVCFGQSDVILDSKTIDNHFPPENPNLIIVIDSLEVTDSLENGDEGNIHSIWKKNHPQEIIIIDGIVTTNSHNWHLTHSIGFAPEESEPVFYVTLQTTNDNKILYGLKGGVYAHQKDLDEAVNEFLQSLGPLNAGSYFVQGNFAITRTPTYIGALSGEYKLNSQFTLDASFGFKYYRDDTYYGEISFSIPANGTPLPEASITPDMPFRVVKSKDIVRAYYSLGMNYSVGDYLRIGVFADNIYSFGANFSIEF